MPSARIIRNAAILGGLGLAAVYAFEAAQYRRTAAKGYQLQNPPTPGTADLARLVEVLTVTPLRQGNQVTVLRNGREIFPAMLAAIQHANETVNFATYVYWTGSIAPQFADALCDAVGRGVDVCVLTNGPHTDKEVVRQAGRRCYEQLLGCGGRIFENQRTMLHAKVLLVDSHWVTVGSINFDNRSFALNDELNISFRDPGVVAELEKHFLADLEDARELTLAAWRAPPLAMRARKLAGALVRREL